MYDLGAQFKYNNIDAKTNPEVVILGNKYRFSVLSDRLIRLEYSETGSFTDLPSQFAIFRNFPKIDFQVKQDDRILEIQTKKFRVEYLKNKKFDSGKVMPTNNLKVTLLKNEKVWYYNHPEARRFPGISSSLDGTKEEQTPFKGLYSLDGFVSFDDSKTLLIDEGGSLIKRDNNNIDLYLFMYDLNFIDAMDDYFTLTGRPPLLPRYALGNWWSRNTNYSDNNILELADKFTKENIPLSVFLLDNDWHISQVLDQKKNLVKATSGYTFNNDLFSNPKSFIEQLHSKNIRLGLNINPKQGLYPHEMYFEKIKEYLPLEKNSMIKFDPLNPRFLDVYFKLLVNPLEQNGIDFFWNDYNGDRNLMALWILNHYHFLDLAKTPAKRGMLLSRGSDIAPHRYSVLYSGKTQATWEMLRKIPKSFQDAANSGISWISHDVAGNNGGIEESELYIRSVQLGVFSPILRFNGARSKYYKREPWRWDIKTKTVVEGYLNHRHQLIPYIYTEAYRYYSEGKPIIKPLYYDIPWVFDDPVYNNQYFFGRELMVAPILEKKDSVMNRTIQKVYVPEGIWYDFSTGKKYSGNKKHVSFYKEEEYPVFAKGGAIIPLSIESGLNNIGNPSILEVHIFPGQNNTYVLYEDDGVTNLYKENYFLKTSIDYNYLPSNYTVIVRSVEGKKGLVPDKRTYRFRFRNTKETKDIDVNFNNDKIEYNAYVDNNDFVVEINNIDSVGQLTINCRGRDIEIEASRVINDDIDSIIMDLQINTYLKEQLAETIFSELPYRKKRVEIRKLRSKGLEKQYIKLFLKLLDYLAEF